MIRHLALLSIFLISLSATAQDLSEAESRQLKLAHNFIQQGQLERAEQYLKPLGQQYQQQQRHYALAVSWQYQAQVAIQQQDYSRALAYLQRTYKLKRLSEEQQQQSLYSIAQLQLQLSHWSAAIESIDAWQAQQDDRYLSAESFFLKAQALANQQDWYQASESIEEALHRQANPQIDWWRFAVALYSQQQRWPAAIKAQLEVLQLSDKDILGWFQLASLYLHNQQPQQALAYMQQAYQQDLFGLEQHYQLLVQLLEQQQQPYRAAKILTLAMQTNKIKSRPDLQTRLCQLWLSAKEYAQAERCLLKLVNKQANGQAYQWLAYSQAQQNLLAKSIHSYQQANLFSDANTAENWLNQGLLYLELAQYQPAKQALKKAATYTVTAPSSQQALRLLQQRLQFQK
ncbi:hypothetical protein ACVFI8_06740 [Agarivorans sp. MS3-6]|uniref:hypothetical protein n=1 Tax=Agarivorans sp. TSD2052 TaxID=2937286 RepID=UPI00200D903F|nr:hypothetical protein [Agarivorans sp. TSD2052]UPW19297.1 hypothetical protein M0C34_03205 [Agarivorans sp. TSD2052]